MSYVLNSYLLTYLLTYYKRSFDQYRPTALVTKLLVIEQQLHPAPKSTVSAP